VDTHEHLRYKRIKRILGIILKGSIGNDFYMLIMIRVGQVS